LPDEVVASLVGVGSPDEPVAAEVVVVAVVAQQVPADDKDGVSDGDGGLAAADASLEPPELCREVGVAGV